MEHKKLPQHLVRDTGVFYVCHRLSQMGWLVGRKRRVPLRHPKTRVKCPETCPDCEVPICTCGKGFGTAGASARP